MDIQHEIQSSSSSTSGYGTQSNSPFDVESWDTWTKVLEEDTDTRCCSLTNPTWRNQLEEQPKTGTDNSTSTPQLDFPAVLPAKHFDPVPTLFSLRNYSQPGGLNAIVTMDAEQIGPDDRPHHPLDVTKNNIFVRKPWGMATNTRTEQVYVADREYHVVLVFGPDGEYQGKIGGRGKEAGQFNRPTGLAYDAVNNRLFIVDKDNHRIQVFCGTTHQFLFTFGNCGRKAAQFRFPWGIAVTKDGYRVAVTDSRNSRIQLFTSDGAYLRQHRFDDPPEMPGRRQLIAYPRGVVFDKSGRFLYVTDFSLHIIYRMDTIAWRSSTIMDKLFRPSGIDLDDAGNLLVCDTRNHHIKIFHPDGRSLGYLDRVGDIKFDLPLDVSVMSSGHVAVLDLNGRVRIF